ncbi:hypothetical protein HanRHA438_Chr14g0664361 [Helianthus annuus]|nr:hypothetical protein HanRHA438_Chr14g0664361 [Helianthus annuus]
MTKAAKMLLRIDSQIGYKKRLCLFNSLDYATALCCQPTLPDPEIFFSGFTVSKCSFHSTGHKIFRVGATIRIG